MINELLINKRGVCVREITIKNFNSELYSNIIDFNKNLYTATWTHKVYNYISNIFETPKCLCGNNLNFVSFKFGYRKHCSIKCATNSPECKEKRNATILKIYGVENVSQSQLIKNKKVKTLLKNYNVTHPLKSEIIKKRIIDTNIKHWGVENVSQSDIVSQNRKNTMLEKYDVEYGFQSNDIKNKIKTTIKNKYNVDFYVQSKENKLSIKNSINSKRIEFYSDHLNIDVSNIIISGNTFIINNLCKKHYSFKINRYALYNRSIVGHIENICTECNPINENASIKENEVKYFINNDLNIKSEKIKLKKISSNKIIINNQDIDIYLPDYKLGIEFNGLYWHSNIYRDINYHLNKTEACEKEGIQLLHIFEDEWIYKKEIVKSIIKSKLGIIENKIFARKCNIKEIDAITCSNFLNDNHIQGNINSKIKLGLYYDDELVSVMTFGKKRIIMGNKKSIEGEYEMLRFCNKLNTIVIGGASRMLSHFIKIYKPKLILTFADRRYSQGNLYKELKFKFSGNGEPKYWYFTPSEMIRHYRFNFRKDVLVKQGFDKNKTENEIMTERGYYRIYDCGNMKFEKIIVN